MAALVGELVKLLFDVHISFSGSMAAAEGVQTLSQLNIVVIEIKQDVIPALLLFLQIMTRVLPNLDILCWYFTDQL